jgi:hypothetical protein
MQGNFEISTKFVEISKSLRNHLQRYGRRSILLNPNG